MSQEKLIKLDSVATRRSLLKAAAAAGGGIVGLTEATGTVLGADDDGLVPLVYTVDRYERPDKIKMIPRERHRRLRVAEELSLNDINDPLGVLNGITVTENNPHGDGLALKLLVSQNSPRVRESLPRLISGIPVVVQENKQIVRLDSGHCSGTCREGDKFDTIVGDIELSVDTGSNSIDVGTIAVVGWNDDSADPYNSALTVYHVIENRSNKWMSQPAAGCSGNRDIAEYRDHSPDSTNGVDAAKYELYEANDPNNTADSAQASITGSWTYNGLTDATTPGTVSCTLAARGVCGGDSAECYTTETPGVLEYTAYYKNEHGSGGDSGGPYVDSDGKLVSLHSGDVDKDGDGDYESYGGVGRKVLNQVNMILYDPSLIN